MPLTALAPLFAGMPGGVELLVIFVVAIIVFGIPALVVIFGGGYLLTRSNDDEDERVAELEEKVEALEAQIDESENTDEDRHE